MSRSRPIAVIATIATLCAAAPASGAVVAPAGTTVGDVALAAGPGGRAVLTWAAGGRGVEVSEFTPANGFGPVATAFQTSTASYWAFGALGPDKLVVLATRGGGVGLSPLKWSPSSGPRERPPSVRRRQSRRPRTSSRSSLPTPMREATWPRRFAPRASGSFSWRRRTAGGSARLRRSGGRATGSTRRGSPSDRTAASSSRTTTAARAPTPSGAPSGGRSARRSCSRGLAGTRTSASRSTGRARRRSATPATSADARSRSSRLALARASAFGRARTVARGANVLLSDLAAAGTTTALSWNDVMASTGVRVAIARGAGHFGRPQNPAAPPFRLRGEAGRYPSQANSVRLAVDARGDVLAAYPYGPFSSVHVALLRAGQRAFGAPRVVSSLGHGGYPQVALTTRRRPLVAWRGGDGSVLATTRIAGARVRLDPPRPALSQIDADELGSRGMVTTWLRCSKTCAFSTIARITTGRGRGQVITRRWVEERVLRSNRALKLRFAGEGRRRRGVHAHRPRAGEGDRDCRERERRGAHGAARARDRRALARLTANRHVTA